MMTKEFMEKLEKARLEELEDVNKYMEWAKSSENETISGILCDMAHDEQTHANAITHILSME